MCCTEGLTNNFARTTISNLHPKYVISHYRLLTVPFVAIVFCSFIYLFIYHYYYYYAHHHHHHHHYRHHNFVRICGFVFVGLCVYTLFIVSVFYFCLCLLRCVVLCCFSWRIKIHIIKSSLYTKSWL